ncbi:MAG: 30S ribosome-binding factor RbfA [Spirochaetales bacterium]|jgi:ribosome-binding factor A|nr:30S ribosome-binding factor RbfA [Spirochaetales bacterium]
MAKYRLERVANLIAQQVGLMISMSEIKDPRVSTLVSVSRVTLSKDLGYAKLYISSFEDHGKLKETVDALNHAAGFIQGNIGKRIRMRNTPRMTFIEDHGIEDSFHLNQKIKEALSQ